MQTTLGVCASDVEEKKAWASLSFGAGKAWSDVATSVVSGGACDDEAGAPEVGKAGPQETDIASGACRDAQVMTMPLGPRARCVKAGC